MSFAPPAGAQGLSWLGSLYEGEAWDGVGRLEIGGKAFCTGALIAPDLVLTAAHCLYDSDTGERVSVEEVEFLAGWRNGRAAAYRRVRRAVAHPDYEFTGPPKPERVRHDLALLELQHPIRNTTIAAFETAAEPMTGAEVGVVSYVNDSRDVPILQERCDVISRQDGIVVMSCQVDFGASGAPVLSFDGDRPRVVSVISAKALANGAPVALGVALNDPLKELYAELEKASRSARLPGIKTVASPGMGGSEAKVVRP